MEIKGIKKNTAIDIRIAVKATLSKESKPWDFEKTSEWKVWLANDFFSQSPEEQRTCGSDIFKLIKDDAGSIGVFVEEDPVFLMEGIILSAYAFNRFKSNKKKDKTPSISTTTALSKENKRYLETISKAVYWTRDMVNLPVSHLNAEQFAKEIKSFCETKYCQVQVLSHQKIKALKMGGLLAVNKGSVAPPSFTIINYKPSNAINQQPIVLVGKGVVYDTGGLSLKPTPGSMDSMKSDMAGAALVAGTIKALADLNIPVNVVGLIPATDNRPGGEAYAPGDIITMYNGSTVEVLNTDAEGRMILADALSYADKFNPELVISAATLTGSAVRAIGTNAAVAMGNAHEKALKGLVNSGSRTHERIVVFPFWEDYLTPMKSEIADLKNIGGPDAGAITAGKFLETFVKHPYIHLDVAGPTWLESPRAYCPKGATGYGVRLLYDFIKNYSTWTAIQKENRK